MDTKEREALLAALLDGRLPDENGRFGPFGGRYVPETLMPAIERLDARRRAHPAVGGVSSGARRASSRLGRPADRSDARAAR